MNNRERLILLDKLNLCHKSDKATRSAANKERSSSDRHSDSLQAMVERK